MTDNAHILDDLGGPDAHRVREVSVMVAMDGPIPEDKLNEIRLAVAEHVKKRGYSLELIEQKLGKKKGVNRTYLSNFLSGSFSAIPEASREPLARMLNDWIEVDARRPKSKAESELIPTRPAKRQIRAAQHGVENSDIVAVVGPAGTGKTRVALELLKIIPGSIYLYVSPDGARKSGFLRLLYEAVWEHRGPARPTLSDVIARLKFSDRLLMIDNADLLHPDTFPIIMSLHDVAKIPIMIIGTHLVLQKLQHDADPLRGQMSSRIGLRVELVKEVTSPKRGRSAEWCTADDIRKLYEAGRVRLHPRAVSRLKDVANYEIGHLRRTERYVRYALAQLPREGTVTITPEILERAIRLVDGGEGPPIRQEYADQAEAVA